MIELSKIHMLSALPHDQLQKLVQEGAKSFPDLTLGTVSGTLDEVVEYARTTPLDIYEIILSRGGMAHALRQVLPIPVISLQFSSDEILKALRDAAGTHRPFAVVGHKTVVEPARPLWQAMGGEDTVAFVSLQEHELPEGIQALKDRGIELVVGDVGAVRNAQALGLDTISFESTAASVLTALQQVDRYAQDTWQLRRELSLARKVSDLSQSALLVLNDQWIPVFSNEKARQLNMNSILRKLHPEQAGRPVLPVQTRQIHKIDNQYYTVVIDQSRSTRHAYFLISVTPLDDKLRESPAIRVETAAAADPLLYLRPRSGFAKQASDLSDHLHSRTGVVLIWGDPGTEQVELAHYFSHSSTQTGFPLVFIECASLTPQEWEGSISSDMLVRYSSGCTVLFNGIQNLLPQLQGRLAVALERNPVIKRRYLILATCTGNPHRLAAEGRLNSDLYRLLSRRSIRIPALDERREDIPELAARYCYRYGEQNGCAAPSFSPQAITLLQNFHWFLNTALFHTVMDRLLPLSHGAPISPEQTLAVLEEVSRSSARSPAPPQAPRRSLKEMEQEIIRQVLEEEGMNHSRAAKRLGISRSTLWRKLGGQGDGTP